MMTTVQNTTSAGSQALIDAMNGNSSASASSTDSAADIQDRFMKLLVAQMKNQDPLNPLDNAQVTSQMAQLSTVTGIDKLNSTLTSLQSNYQTSQTLQASSMIGHGVLVPGSTMTLGSSGSSYFGVDLPQAADGVTISVKDAGGNVVHKMNVGTMAAGVNTLQWDGKTDKGDAAPAGTYTVEVSATAGGSAIANVTPLIFGNVDSVSTSAQGVKLNVSGAGSVDVANVRQIL